MNPKGKKLEPKLGLDMPFSELVRRLIQTKPKEVERSIARAKQKEVLAPRAGRRRKKA